MDLPRVPCTARENARAIMTKLPRLMFEAMTEQDKKPKAWKVGRNLFLCFEECGEALMYGEEYL